MTLSHPRKTTDGKPRWFNISDIYWELAIIREKNTHDCVSASELSRVLRKCTTKNPKKQKQRR